MKNTKQQPPQRNTSTKMIGSMVLVDCPMIVIYSAMDGCTSITNGCNCWPVCSWTLVIVVRSVGYHRGTSQCVCVDNRANWDSRVQTQVEQSKCDNLGFANCPHTNKLKYQGTSYCVTVWFVVLVVAQVLTGSILSDLLCWVKAYVLW